MPTTPEPQISQISQNRYRDPLTYDVIGAAMEVHRVLGPGFLERAYQEALALEFAIRDIPFSREVAMTITYKGRVLACEYRADFVVRGTVLVELKAQRTTGPVDSAQVLNYLKAGRLPLALLLNFGAPSLEVQRFAMGWDEPPAGAQAAL